MLTEIIIGLVALLSMAGAGFGAWAMGKREGRKDARTEIEIDQFNEFIATRKRVQDAIDASRDSGSDWHNRLRDNAAADKRNL